MNIRIRVTVAVMATSLALATLAACSAASGTYSSKAPSPAASSAAAAPAPATALSTASTSLGTIVVDGKSLTVYVFDKDTKGAGSSACSGGCATTWPAVESATATPSVTGVTGTVGTITGTDGKLQVTLNGLPLYTFASDSGAGDVKGQGVGGIWWVVAPDGSKISTAP